VIDDDDLNEDWLKTFSWDLPTDFDTFVAYAGGTKPSVQHWIDTHVAAIAMPPDLARQVHAWLNTGPEVMADIGIVPADIVQKLIDEGLLDDEDGDG